ncbi:MAG: ADP-ribosylglycohydrolase family protein [Steroidobacteraceae bacterium]
MSAPPAALPPLPLRNCYWVLPGLLLAGEHPGGTTRAKTKQRLQRLQAAGIECFVDLTHPAEVPGYDADLPFNIEYLSKPIQDHGLPAAPAEMTEILACIQDALQARRPVYVHCRAGIGRTGMVVGCLLVELGLPGEEALVELNRVWQLCKRSKSWAFVPETDDQTNYVRSWSRHARQQSPQARPPAAGAERLTAAKRTPVAARASTAAKSPAAARASAKPPVAAPSVPISDWEPDPLLDPTTLAAARGLRERFLGALLGLAVGDAVAAATQYRRPGSFTPVGDMLGGGPFDLPRGAWSDDTAMALCLAESLLETNGFDARDQMTRYGRWQQDGYLSATGHCVGITAHTARALAMSRWRRHVFAGSHDPNHLDPEPLSRVAPAVLFFFSSLDTAVQQAADAARTTCQAPAVLDACRQLARALHVALSALPKAAVLADMPQYLQPSANAGATAAGALASAVWAFDSTDNYRDAVLCAVNLGGNSDVVAAVCGQLAGAHYGVTAIPSSWRNGLIQKDLIESYADRLLTQSLLTLAG